MTLPTNFVNDGLMTGVGIFAASGTLGNAGHLAPGAPQGTLTIAANFEQKSIGSLDVDLTSVALHDLLLVSGSATLDWTLALNCLDACSMAVGEKIVVLDASGSLAGSFASVTLSNLGTGAFDVIYDQADGLVLLPEPATWLLMLGGFAAIGGWVRRRQG